MNYLIEKMDSSPVTSCCKEHLKVFKSWFDVADSDRDGRITAKDAATFFAMSKLSKSELKEVWTISDSNRLGYLGFKQFVLAMKLISFAQQGNEVTREFYKCTVDLDLPTMEGVSELLANYTEPISNDNSVTEGDMQIQPSPLKRLFRTDMKKKKTISLTGVTSVIDGLKLIYNQKLKPLEARYRFNEFASPFLTSSDFDAKPLVMLLGPYSTGKTTFINQLLRRNYPGAHMGTERTTDRFIAIMSGPDERNIPGDTVAADPDLPFSGLTTFGGSFLSQFECVQLPHPLLEHMTFVDTPGVLSGENQRTESSFDFTGVMSWFVAKCDLILLFFDPDKLDIGNELKRVIASLHGRKDKIRVVLNKADQVDTQQLMKVYGSLMWSLGNALKTPEAARVYVGSFNDKPVNEAAMDPKEKEFFKKEKEDLLQDLTDLPKKACDRRVNELLKRARAAKIHAYIIGYLKREMPTLFGKPRAQENFISKLDIVFAKIQREFHLQAGDFPDVDNFRKVLKSYNIEDFEKLKASMIEDVDDMIANDIPKLLKSFRNLY